jgi:outer membrane protein TolC
MLRLFSLLLTAFVCVSAQIPEPPRVGVGLAQRRLTLRQAVEMALQSNLDIEIERSNTANAVQSLRAARGFYDLSFRWNPGLESRATPTGSVLQSASGKLTDHFHTQNFTLSQPLPWHGTSVSLDFENTRQSTSNSFVSLNPYLTSRLTLGFTQPLGRNRETDAERSQIRIRSKQVDLSENEFETRAIDVIHRVEQAYWDLLAARQDVDVKRDNVDWAQKLVAQNQRMIAAGTLASVELAASQAELERRLDDYYSSVGLVTQVENTLKALLIDGHQADLWSEQIIPTDERTIDPPQVVDLRQAVEEALKKRPETRAITLQQESNDLQKRLNADQLKPQVNLVAAYSNMGLGGAESTTPNPFAASSQASTDRLNELSRRAGLAPLPAVSFGSPPGMLVGGYGAALSNLFAGRFQSLQLGLAFDWNIRNTTAEAGYSQSLIAERRLRLQQARLEQAVSVEVRNALQLLTTARQRIRAAEAGARAAREKLESETRLFEAGESTNFLVLTRQNEYADSRHRAVVARLDFNRAVSRLERALGTTLQTHNVTLR